MDRPTANPVQIGDWYANPASGEIMRDGATVRPDPRAMRLLLYLADRPGQVVSVEELLNQVWSGVVVTQDSVYQAIAAVRRVLGDDPKNPTYIVTVPRLGYRLIAKVHSWNGEPPATRHVTEDAVAPTVDGAAINGPATPTTPSDTPLRAAPTRRVTLIAVLCLGAFLIGVLTLLLRGQAVTWPGTGGATNATAVKSIGVLPFLDLTSESMDQEYFADGMTEELIDKLSRLPGIRVPSPASSFYFKGKRLTVAQIAKSLGVTYVLSGSVRQSEQKLRIAVRLVRADDGYVIWSETYDRSSGDKLLVQDDIATQVAKALQRSIG
jgi:TolB-like protein/DNA-binding winged helix-turn-helix (wHTH) protein